MLTSKQRKLLLFVHGYIQANGIAPSFEEMSTALDMKAKSGIHRMLDCLVERKFITRLQYRARAIEVIRLPEDVSPTHFHGIKIVSNPMVPEGEMWVRGAA